MNVNYWITINGLICIIAMFLIVFFLNKDYNLNGAKRILSSSKYGRIAYWLSLFLLIWFVNTIQGVIDVLIEHEIIIVNSTIYNLLFWIGIPLLGFIFIGSILWTTYANYKTRKREGIKYDKDDV